MKVSRNKKQAPAKGASKNFLNPALPLRSPTKVQDVIDNNMSRLDNVPEYKHYVNGICNSLHGDNISHSLPRPFGPNKKALMVNEKIGTNIYLPTLLNDNRVVAFTILATEVPSTPLVCVYEFATGSPIAIGMYSPWYVTNKASIDAPPITALKTAKVFSVCRNGGSLRVEPTTAEAWVSGQSHAVILPPCTDINYAVLNYNLADDGENQPVIQRIPDSGAAVSRLNDSKTRPTRAGAYLIHKTMKQDVYRTTDLTKAFDYANQLSTYTTNAMKVQFGTNYLEVFSNGNNDLNYPSNFVPAMALRCLADPCFNRSTVLLYRQTVDFVPLQTTVPSPSWSVAFAQTIEMQLHSDSPFYNLQTDRPLYSRAFADAAEDFHNMIFGNYDADANFLNRLWDGFKSFWGKFGQFIKPALSLIPGVAPFVGPGSQILDIITGK